MNQQPLVLQIEPNLSADRLLIGGKAASLVQLTQLGARVPAAFVLTTEAYRSWERYPADAFLEKLIKKGLSGLQVRTGTQFGQSSGLIVSVRSGAPVSMPGMMDTVLNVGLGTLGTGHEPFLYEARVRFVLQYAQLILGLDEPRLDKLRSSLPPAPDAPSLASLERAVSTLAAEGGLKWPTTPLQEVVEAVKAVFASWQSSRAKLYRRMRKIDDSLGTTVTIQQMVFGNRDSRSGSGVAFSRNPTTGAAGLNGEILVGGQGEDVVAGRAQGMDLGRWGTEQLQHWSELEALARQLERTTTKVHEIEFTVERDRFYLLQCRPALLTAVAAARIAVEMAQEGLITREQALAYARQHGFDPDALQSGSAVRSNVEFLGRGLAVGGGVGVGLLALTNSKAEEQLRTGKPVVYAAVETSPGLLPIMQRAAALVTMRGGATSHAAVIARELRIPCVVGIGSEISNDRIQLGDGIVEGELVTVDGDSGCIYRGDVSMRDERLSASEQTLRQWSLELKAAHAVQGG